MPLRRFTLPWDTEVAIGGGVKPGGPHPIAATVTISSDMPTYFTVCATSGS